MCNLLSANLYRLRKSRSLYLAVLATFFFIIMVVLTCWDHYAAGTAHYTLESVLTSGFGLMGYLPVPTLILAPLLSVCLGTEYSENTVRNKLIIGHTRTGIYFSELLACMLTALALDILYMLLTGLLCIHPVLQMSGKLLQVSPWQMLAWVGTALLARAAYVSVVKLLAAVLPRRTEAAVGTLLLAVGTMFLCKSAFGQIQSLEFNMAAGVPVRNGPARLAFWHLLVDVLPTGQYLQVSRLDTPNLWRMPLFSLAVIACTTAAGLLLFRRKYLK